MNKEIQQELLDWEVSDIMGFLNKLKSIWWHGESAIKTQFKKNKLGEYALNFEIHTLGWSDNEEIMESVYNSMVWDCFWVKTERGGHYYFQMDLKEFGWEKVSDFCIKHKTYRAYVYKFKEKYNWIHVSKGIKLIRAKVK